MCKQLVKNIGRKKLTHSTENGTTYCMHIKFRGLFFMFLIGKKIHGVLIFVAMAAR